MLYAQKNIATLTIAIVVALSSTGAMAQSWSNWERDHAVSQHKAFLVIKQPGEGFCYVKQSYDNDSNKMELSFKGASPTIVTPAYRGIDGDVRYWIDGGAKYTVPSSDISGANSFELPANVVDQMKAGRILHVRVKPSGQPIRTQNFSLLGFTAATRVLSGQECQDDGAGQASSNLEVKLTRNSDGGVVVSGNTSLPDGMKLMISLRADGGEYYAQDKVQVASGFYKSAAFSDEGRGLLSGDYRVSISSPLMDLQPASVKEKLGSSGSGISEDIRQRSSFGDSYTVKYSVSRTVE